MSKTGVYIFDENTRQVIKISDEIPRIPKDIWYPRGGYKYFDKALNKEFSSKTEKRDYMKSNGLVELLQTESNKQKHERCAAVINEDRRKNGMKPKTISELRGVV